MIKLSRWKSYFKRLQADPIRFAKYKERLINKSKDRWKKDKSDPIKHRLVLDKHNKRLAKYRKQRPQYYRDLVNNFNDRVRDKVFIHYGNKCSCCNEKTREFFTIDHINGGGLKQRKKLKKWGVNFYKWIIKDNYPKEFRILCWNCHFSISVRGYCPHSL